MMRRRLLLTLTLLLVTVAPAFSLPLPSYGVTLGLTSTSNLFQDSLGLGDRFTGLTVDLDQSLTRNLLLYYTGRAELYTDYSDLGNTRHTGGFELGEFIGNRGEVWAVLEGESFSYGEYYSDYNRQAGRGKVGWGWVASPVLRLRGDLTGGMIRYPNADTSDVDVNNYSATLGINLGLNIPLAVNLELGGSSRQYIELPTGTSAEALWATLRLSRPLAQTTGIAMELTLREQLDVGGDGLVALYESGIDPGDLLWDGWKAGIDLNHRTGPWSVSFTVQGGVETYVETQALTGRGRREDRAFRTVASVRRSFATGNSPNAPIAAIGGAWLWINNESTDSFYTWSGNSVMLTFMLISP